MLTSLIENANISRIQLLPPNTQWAMAQLFQINMDIGLDMVTLIVHRGNLDLFLTFFDDNAKTINLWEFWKKFSYVGPNPS